MGTQLKSDFTRPNLKAKLSPNAITILERRYLVKDDKGKVIETPEDMFWRVAISVATAEQNYINDKTSAKNRIQEIANEFYELMVRLNFMPNSPTLMNAGRKLGQYFACFVLPIADSIIDENDEGIFDAIRSTAYIHKTGGGTGFSFSRLRPEGSIVSTTYGKTSGPISFMKVFNQATNAIHQGGFRRGANMGVMRIDHPDILDFINIKSNLEEMTNFNLSVAITDDFIQAVKENMKHIVIDPHTRKKTSLREKVRDSEGILIGYKDYEWTAREIWDLTIERAWQSGEPGIIFIDRINYFNPTPQLGKIEATNPCGEQPLLPWEACNLGSLNLAHFISKREIDWQRLAKAIKLAVRFLDNVIDVNTYPKPQIEKMAKGNRKIGLGVMGWADLLCKLGICYNSTEAIELAKTIMKFIKNEGWKASMELAKERGAFPNFEGSLFTSASLDHPYFAEPWVSECVKLKSRIPIRNATVTTIAPTGTISIIAGASGGIEPLFSLYFYRHILDGEKLLEVHPYFKEVAEANGFYKEEVLEKIISGNTISDIDEIPKKWRNLFVTAHDISPEWHIKMQSAFQEYTDNAVSKTVNFPYSTTKEDIKRVYELAIELRVKGVTVYRDESRENQPMAKEFRANVTPKKRALQSELDGMRFRIPTNLGTAFITITEDELGPRECFTSIGKAGSDINALSEAICRLISTALGYAVPMEELAKQLLNITSQPIPCEGGFIKSLPDAIAKAMLRYLAKRKGCDVNKLIQEIGKPTGALCPDCGAPLIFEESCSGGKCRSCGYGNC